MKKVILILVICIFHILSAQDKIRDLETRGDAAEGQEKIKILLESIEQYSETDPKKAAEYSRRVLQLLQELADKKTETHSEYAAEKKENEIKQLKEKEKRHLTLIKLYLVIAFLISLIAVINFILYRSKRKAEKAIRESQERYRELVERSNDGIAIVQDGLLKFVNPELSNMLGYSGEEVIGKQFELMVAPKERKRLMDINRRRINGEEVKNKYETILLHRKGQKVHVEINAGVISYENRPATLAFVHNTSERKLLEEERIKRSKLEAVGSLAGGIAHDFNNLLAVILGNIELARLFPKSEEKLAKILTKAEKAALKARDLTKRFLTFSEGGAPFKKLISLQSVIKEAMEVTVSSAGISFDLDIPARLWEIRCDEEQIYQVFSSLIANAAEAVDGEGVIAIRAENLDIKASNGTLKRGKYVKIVVKDEGEGIAEAHMPKIFDPYFSTRGRVSQKGLGFGLSIVYSIITQHNGHIEVESELKVGTTVTVYLPVS